MVGRSFLKIFFILVITTNGQLYQLSNISNVISPEPRIIGGVMAGFKGHEHQVSIRLKASESNSGFGQGHICGGSIISSTKVLTAAHCLYKVDEDKKLAYLRYAKDFTVVMGVLNRFVQTSNYVQRDVKSYIYHSGFDLDSLVNDIAVLFLNQQIPSNHPYIRPIRLITSKIPEGTNNCTISGWGRTGWNDPPSAYLMTANVIIVDQNQCAKIYERTGHKIRKGMFCAGNWYGEVDSCQGDSGGPLTCFNYLTGIVSWGNGCGLPRYPGVYTDVSYYIDWIRNAKPILSNNPNKSSYTNTFNVKILLVILGNFIFINNIINIQVST